MSGFGYSKHQRTPNLWAARRTQTHGRLYGARAQLGGFFMGSHGAFAVRVHVQNEIARIAVSGDLDLYSAPDLQARIAEWSRPAVAGIMVDLRDVTFIDSAGLRVLLGSKTRAERAGHRFFVVGASDAIRRVFELTETTRVLENQDVVTLLDQFVGTQRPPGEAVLVDSDAGR